MVLEAPPAPEEMAEPMAEVPPTLEPTPPAVEATVLRPLPPPSKPPQRASPKPTIARLAAPTAIPVAASVPTAAAPEPRQVVISPTWRNALTSWLRAHRTYPEAARRRGDQGRVMLRFTVERDGRVSDAALVQGSGFPNLDDAAVALVRNAHVPPLPADMEDARVTVTIPIAYELER